MNNKITPSSQHSYDLGLIGPALLTYQRETSELDTVSIAAIVGSAKLGAVVGTFIGGACMLYYGRQPTIALSGVFFVIGPALMAAFALTWVLIIGRLLIGLGIGISAVAIPAYLGEISPAKVCGCGCLVLLLAVYCNGLWLKNICHFTVDSFVCIPSHSAHSIVAALWRCMSCSYVWVWLSLSSLIGLYRTPRAIGDGCLVLPWCRGCCSYVCVVCG